MEKIHLENSIKSFFLGLFIGVILLFFNSGDVQVSYKVLTILASGSIGFIIGFITEWLTSILPISMANPRNYFLINNLIALIVTIIILTSLAWIAGGNSEGKGNFTLICLTVLSIICTANLFDYIAYRRAQRKLKLFKAGMKDK
ncbi:hypothetical protein [Paenibacillus gorillae]|uniref:hypothetical protein n=1 Tax=Paenibacillus gorillae TaxID=1243662 RepID=UPI0004B81B88|nr:hypothetical protein [Paenibacillus gorillae]